MPEFGFTPNDIASASLSDAITSVSANIDVGR